MVRRLLRFLVLVAVVIAGFRWLLAHRAGELRGLWYRISGRHPDPDVDDLTLADRVRSELGPLEHRLDLPHVHVMVEDHVVLLHGDVAGGEDAAAIESAVRRVSGVEGVESYLHVGLLRSDTRPSRGRSQRQPPSAAKRALLTAAGDSGAGEEHASEAVRVILSVFADRIPAGERAQLLAHLPHDVREMVTPPRHLGRASRHPRTMHELVSNVFVETDAPLRHAMGIVEAVLHQLRQLAPEEAGDVAAVLPQELREMWATAATG